MKPSKRKKLGKAVRRGGAAELVRWKSLGGKYSKVHRVSSWAGATACDYKIPPGSEPQVQHYLHLHDSLDDLGMEEICQLCFPESYSHKVKIVQWRRANGQLNAIHEVGYPGLTRCGVAVPTDAKKLVKRVSYLNMHTPEELCGTCFGKRVDPALEPP